MPSSFEFFSWQTLGTVAGATLATVLVVNALRAAFNWSPQWLGLLVAALLQAAVWWFASDQSAQALVMALINAVVVYLAAIGGNQLVATRQPRDVRAAGPDKRFWRPWFPAQ